MPSAQELAAATRAYVISPAGHGKTHLIAEAVQHNESRQLVLTHTHAGVAALRTKLANFGVSPRKVRVATIAGLALQYSGAYPSTSGVDIQQPVSTQWRDVQDGAARVFDARVGRDVLAATYGGLYVDEYQDCTTSQHELILLIANVLPTRLLGDPMQGIFGFNEPLVDWTTIDAQFDRLGDLTYPWRWQNANRDLGDWLAEARRTLEAGEELDFSTAPVTTGSNRPASQVAACAKFFDKTSVVAIRRDAPAAHDVAKRLGGRYTSMEEIECRALLSTARKLDQTTGNSLAAAVIEFARACMTNTSTHLRTSSERLNRGEALAPRARASNEDAVRALEAVRTVGSPDSIAMALTAVAGLPDVKIYRRELLGEMKRTLRLAAGSPDVEIATLAWAVRDRSRHAGRHVARRIVSRTLLIKGLEFDHALVLDASEHNPKNLYVAITRPRQSLTVLVPDP